MKLPVIVVGAQGHAKVVLDVLRECGFEVLGFVTREAGEKGALEGLAGLGDERVLERYTPDKVMLANGVGTVGPTARRRAVFERLHARGYRFATLVHPRACVARSAVLDQGAQVMAGAVLQPDVRVGANSIINTSASIDHDCVIGAHVHIAPGVTLSGAVRVGDGTHIGTGAIAIQGVSIGEEAFVAAGAVVVRNVPARRRVQGVPAQEYS
jgi:sugar O-acyltransferase (sialic acid O-acetyltransferase NeuD family)